MAAFGLDNLSGAVLIATSVLESTEFARSVIYVCTHSPQEGAIGVVVNCALPDSAADDVWRQLDLSKIVSKKDISLGLGGPVEPSRGFILHSADSRQDGHIARLSTSMEVLHDLKSQSYKAMMLLGHTAWDPGQLEDEIVHDNAWFIGSPDEEIVFGAKFDDKWTNAIRSLGIDPLGLSHHLGEA